jgi:hypothetical protein
MSFGMMAIGNNQIPPIRKTLAGLLNMLKFKLPRLPITNTNANAIIIHFFMDAIDTRIFY